MNKSEIAKQLLGFMRAHKNQFVLSILLAILGVASGMIPYFAIARIMLYLLEGIREMSIYAFWCMMVLLGFSLKIIFANLSTAVSHTATFYTLKEIHGFRWAISWINHRVVLKTRLWIGWKVWSRFLRI